jgi:hypothetical protein
MQIEYIGVILFSRIETKPPRRVSINIFGSSSRDDSVTSGNPKFDCVGVLVYLFRLEDILVVVAIDALHLDTSPRHFTSTLHVDALHLDTPPRHSTSTLHLDTNVDTNVDTPRRRTSRRHFTSTH